MFAVTEGHAAPQTAALFYRFKQHHVLTTFAAREVFADHKSWACCVLVGGAQVLEFCEETQAYREEFDAKKTEYAKAISGFGFRCL